MKNTTPATLLEISVYSVLSAVSAWKSGADRIELCTARGEGGTTPSYGMIRQVRKEIPVPLFVMIRPRGGDFYYTAEEFEVMKNDLLEARNLGADGIATGILTPNGEVDKIRMEELISLAYPMEVTFHRAFDMVREAENALQVIIDTGATHVLTSGLEKDAVAGTTMIKHLVEKASNRITIVPGGGVHSGNIVQLAEDTGATEFHTSAKHIVPGNMNFRRTHVYMAKAYAQSEYDLVETDPVEVRKCVTQLTHIKRK
jgi:copper homeostasis protein